MMDLYIVGFGGFAKEVFCYAKELEFHKFRIKGFVEKSLQATDNFNIINHYCDVPIYNENIFDYNRKNIVVAVGNPQVREKIVNNILTNFDSVEFPNVISPTANVMSDTVRIGQGIIICSGAIVTCDVDLGNFVNLNLNTTVGHDAILKQYVTTATNVSISGRTILGRKVYMGNNSCILENLEVVNNTIIGAGCVVNKSITEEGTYVGIPARKIK